jgi:hypothetical protein
MLAEFLRESRIAYFTTEVALRDEIPTYAGGLGIFAVGLKSATFDMRQTACRRARARCPDRIVTKGHHEGNGGRTPRGKETRPPA